MLKPLYELFGVAQPPVLPRRSLTFITEEEAETLMRLLHNQVELVLRSYWRQR